MTGVKAAPSHLGTSVASIDPLLRFGREPHHLVTSRSSVIRRLQRLQRRLRLDLAPDEPELGLPAEMIAFIPIDSSPFQAAVELLTTTQTFDEDFYRQKGTLAIDPGLDARSHFLTRGWQKRMSPNFYFDPDFYCAQAGMWSTRNINPFFHYLYVGEPAGLRPSQHFDPVWYRARYGLSGQSPFCHYLRHRHEKRFSPNSDFDLCAYLQKSPGALGQSDDPFLHYVHVSQSGPRQQRARGWTAPGPNDPSAGRDIAADMKTILASRVFDADWYRHHAGQRIASRKGLARHYLLNDEPGRPDPGPLFNTEFYLRTYGSEINGADPLAHYLREGWTKDFDPHPLFSVSFYLAENEDVRAAGREPLGHYLESGWREGRSPCEEFDVAYYLEQNDDVRKQGCEPLRHFLDYGAAEGRKPSSTFETGRYAREVLKGEAQNPLIHFKANGSKVDDQPHGVGLSNRYEMSKRGFERWLKTFPDPVDSAPPAADLVRVTDLSGPMERAPTRRAAHGRVDAQRRVYLVCEPTDDIDERLLPYLTQCMTRADLVIFDLVIQKSGIWIPVLMPGANPTHLESVDASFSRFAISSGLLDELKVSEDAKAYQVLRAALARLRETGRLHLFAHVSIPILRIGDVSERLRSERFRLAHASHVGSRSKATPAARLSVSVVICSKDRCRLLSQLLDSLSDHAETLVREIVVVANPAADSYAAKIHADYEKRRRIEVLRHEGPYNFSQQSNRGAARCSGDLLLFLNDDIVSIVPHWLDALVAVFARPEVGVAGPLLFCPDERVQHAGMYLGYNDVAGHTLRGARLPDDDYMFMGSAARNVSAVTGAALLTRRSLFEDLNGFDRQLGTYLQDVDYCLRVLASGHDVIFEPRSMLFHMESVSMREDATESVFADRRPLEHRHFTRRWGALVQQDAFHNPSFDTGHEHLRALATAVQRQARG